MSAYGGIVGAALAAGAASANQGVADPLAYGMSASNANTTGSISASSAVLTLAAALDFQNGQGIRINHAGAAFTLGAPTSPTATAEGATGSTTYQYKLASIDAAGGVGAATASFQVTNGPATLSFLNYVAISATAPTGTAPAGYAVYRNVSGTYTLVGFINSSTPTFNDFGYGVSHVGAPDYVPTTAPASALADWLVTSIVSGAGTITLTLAAAATTAASGLGVYHDDTAALNAAIAAAQASGGNALDLPPGQINVTGAAPITNAGFRLRGFGVGTVVFRVNPTGTLFTLTGGKSLVADLFFQANALQSGGSYIDLGPAGNNTLRNIRAYGGPGVIAANTGGQNLIIEFVFVAFTQAGVAWIANGAGTDVVANGTMFCEPQVTYGQASSRGLSVQGGATLMWSHINCGGQHFPVYVKPDAGQLVTDIDATHVLADGQGFVGAYGLSGPGWTLDGSNSGATLRSLRLTHCWAGSMSNTGALIKSVDSLSALGFQAMANAGRGVDVEGSHGLTFTDLRTIGNSAGSSGTYDGLYIGGTSALITVSGGISGTNAQLSTATQRYGVATDNTNYIVIFSGMISLAASNVTGGWYLNGAASSAPSPSNQ